VIRSVPGGNLSSASEAAIVALAIDGDDAAYGELVRRRQESIRNLLRRLTRDAALADDLAQQAFIQAWRSIRSLNSPRAFGAWLRKLAVNGWLMHLRARRTEVELDESVLERGAGSPVAEQLDLDAALERLPANARLCIVLAYSEGLSHSEISDCTGIALGTVKSHITRGAARLRDLLEAYGDRHVERV
jgi:RNA polymerase sigma-70 factor (ECF subfamily)